MSNPPRPADDALAQRARRIKNSLADLNARIARLSIFLQLPLDTEAQVQLIVERTHPLFQRHDAQQAGAAAGGQHRQGHALEELRGLLVLRCKVMAKLLDNLGLELTGQIVNQAEDHLDRLGFKPGADGFRLLPRTEP
ncbi:MAG: hypothetical protein NTX37_11585 [Burkholderiales bacterium]|nr:hypothetical protein [Burkholderiales bacterium]